MKYPFFSPRREFLLFIILPFVLWLLSFWGYFSGKMALIQDATSYYDHIGFFTDNIMRGVYPLWHPDWAEGAVPYNFFLRRIGDVNPIFWVLAFFKAVGIKQVYAHLMFLAFYFLLSVTAFWLIARIIFRDRLLAVVAYLLLLFSSWGGQLFYTYIVILFTPILWFFYFLLAFAAQGKRHQFLGICFATGILATTYIPFFFLTILIVFMVTFPLFFWQEARAFIVRFFSFAKHSRAAFISGVVFLLIACMPAMNFYAESKKGEFALPGRHAGAPEASTLTVSPQLAAHGDLITQGYFENIFDNHSAVSVESFFITFFVFIIILLSVVNPVTRRGGFFLVTAFILTALSVTQSAPVYKFVYAHVFFFKFMRNIYYIFWLAILPLLILFTVEQLRLFMKEHGGKRNTKVLLFVTTLHAVFATWLLFRENILWTAWVVVAASLVFFVGIIRGDVPFKWMIAFLLAALMVQPVHIFITMATNGTRRVVEAPKYSNEYFRKFKWQRGSTPIGSEEEKEVFLQEIQKGLYYANRWYVDIYTYVPSHELQSFLHNKFYLADNTTIYDDNTPQFCRKMGSVWRAGRNVVFLAPDKALPTDVRSSAAAPADIEIVTGNSSAFKVLAFDVNTLKLVTDLTRPRFLVWTDNYDSGWHVFINGKEERVLRVYHAFKGLWLPEGKNTVLFRFATPARYLMAYILMACFILMLGAIVFLSRREGFLIEERVEHGPA